MHILSSAYETFTKRDLMKHCKTSFNILNHAECGTKLEMTYKIPKCLEINTLLNNSLNMGKNSQWKRENILN